MLEAVPFFSCVFFGNSIARYLIFIAFLVVLAVVVKLIYLGLKKILSKISTEDRKTLRENLFDALEEPIIVLIAIFGLQIAKGILILAEKASNIYSSTIKILFTVLLVWVVYRAIILLIVIYLKPRAEKSKGKFDDQIILMFRKALNWIFVLVIVLIVLKGFGFNISVLLAGLGIGGLAIAFAAQETLGNLLGGITLFADRAFEIRDFISVAGKTGTVEDMSLRSTKIRTLDGTLVTIPNKTIANENVENYTKRKSYFYKITIGLTYGTSAEKIKEAQKILEKIARDVGVEFVRASFYSFGDFSLNLDVAYNIKDVKNYQDVVGWRNKINMEILKRFNKAKLDFAFPTQTIHLKK